ncbi:MAG: lipoprotein signal peptidase [Pseudomonadales bacterium]|nr:lipoprotein signal peptidase [Pseudomonadales bacterium]
MRYLILPLIVVLSDQFTKHYMSDLLVLCSNVYCESIEVLPVFKFVLLHNTGAAFSFLSDAGGWQRWFLVSISFVVSIFVAVWLYNIRQTEKVLGLGLAFVLGGAIGNLIDRVNQGYVVDFISVYWEQYHFPVFNVADSAIFIGACLLILDIFLKSKEESVKAALDKK